MQMHPANEINSQSPSLIVAVIGSALNISFSFYQIHERGKRSVCVICVTNVCQAGAFEDTRPRGR